MEFGKRLALAAENGAHAGTVALTEWKGPAPRVEGGDIYN